MSDVMVKEMRAKMWFVPNYSQLLNGAGRDRVIEILKAQGIPTAMYYPQCLHEQPVFASLGYPWGNFPESERASREVLSLPIHPILEEPNQDRVVQCMMRYAAQSR